MQQDLQNSTGKQDVRFLIVNSRDQASMSSAPALRDRVSLPIIQESPLQPIWSRLQGVSGDVFVYDRCGRLAYYVPFPLSYPASGNMSAVRFAVLEVHEQSPCGEECPQEQPSTTVPPTTPFLHYARAFRPGQTRGVRPGVRGSLFGNRISEDSAGTTASPIPKDSLSWSIARMFFRRNSTDSNATSENTTLGILEGNLDIRYPENHTMNTLLLECRDMNKSTCYDWPKEVLQRVDRCCNSSSLSEEQPTRRNPCGMLTRRRCTKLRPLISCCKGMFLIRDRQLAREYEDLFRDFDRDAYEDLLPVSCSEEHDAFTPRPTPRPTRPPLWSLLDPI